MTQPPAWRGPGRPPASSREHIERSALQLFRRHGYTGTTVPMIAAECGVSRTSIFRYWGSKSEILWSAFDENIDRLGAVLRDADPTLPVIDVVREAIREVTTQSVLDSSNWLDRFAVIEYSPELRADESERWRRWAEAVATFLHARLGRGPDSVLPSSAAAAIQAALATVLRSHLSSPMVTVETLVAEIDDALSSMQPHLEAWIEATDRGHSTPHQ